MKWEFTQAEFMFAWDRLGFDHFPAPLVVNPPVQSQAEWQAIEKQLRLRLSIFEDPDLVPVLRTAADPETSLVMAGFRNRPLRAYGAITSNIGVSIVQRTGPHPESSGDIVVEVGSPSLVARVFAAVAGNRVAGRHPAMVETWERVQDGEPVGENSVADRIRCLLSAPRTGHGHIEVRVGRKNARPHPPRYLSWFDVDGDGRYTYTRRYGDFRIDPCDSDRFRQAVGHMTEP
ncbi:EspG family protein [Nocardia nova SH22a]|uniref:EspG family protein n=1 Tax=Nocardia nova SH22a TaxID=1415166 RepID=W5TMN7_9NOCA|nr:ESX secretion-associated protein EspG [Nocardia nova]AHH20527.1 EspG family protein [Nocardia nova SH22a]